MFSYYVPQPRNENYIILNCLTFQQAYTGLLLLSESAANYPSITHYCQYHIPPQKREYRHLRHAKEG